MKASDPVRRIEYRYLDGDLSAPLLATRSVIGAKARRMSFFLTIPQVRGRTKTVTRRAIGTWTTLRPGNRLVAIEKGQGLKDGEKHTVLALLEVVSVRVEQLNAITTEDCAREGFPGVTPAEFVSLFLKPGRGREAAEQLAANGRARTELAVVLYVLDADGEWRPSQVFKRHWQRYVDGSEGWSYDLFDGSWCRRDQRLHLYNSGGGPPYVNGFAEPGIHGRLWMLDGESVSGDGLNPNRDGPIGARRAPALSDADLLAMGIERTTEHPGDIFADASDEPTTYCEACNDEIPRHANPCEHLCSCDHCGATYKSEGEPEDRCPDCNTSQLECEDCGECGGETCISCSRNICSSCWSGHVAEGDDPCERGEADWQEPE